MNYITKKIEEEKKHKMTMTMFFNVLFSLLVSIRSLPMKPTLNYESIFVFGDSLSDTGNFLISGDAESPFIGRPPYGSTFFNRPTGRCSDGRLIIDFIAEASGLPYVPPYLQSVRTNNSVDFKRGANFAVAGATASEFGFLKERGLSVTLLTNKTLDIQLGWFKNLKPSLCKTKPECEEYFNKSLFFVGEIGGNDYNYPLLAFRSFKDAMDLVPFVINKIINVTRTLIEEGAVTMVVPGILPFGCSAVLLERFDDGRGWLYDPRNQCYTPLNIFAKLHNDKLKKGLEALKIKYPHAKIMYADYYGSAMQFFNSPSKYGFTGSVLKACCGGEDGRYNAKPSVQCGKKGSTTCTNPSTYANWDGIHLTEAAYHHIANGVISGRFIKPSFNNN